MRKLSASAVAFQCQGSTLIGVVHQPAVPPEIGVVFVTAGGPQYRVGGHRQQTLWARKLSDCGYAALCFDYRGVGDSGGDFPDFTGVDADISAAIDTLTAAAPTVRKIVLWGECNASSAILYYAHSDKRVRGAVLLNPWVRTAEGEAQATLRYYYAQRLLQPSFWKKLLAGRFNLTASINSLVKLVRDARSSTPGKRIEDTPRTQISRTLPLTEGMLQGLQRFNGEVMLVMSGRDMVAREFDLLLNSSPDWRAELARCKTTRHDMPEGDHTFSSRKLRDQVIDWATAWLARQ